MTKWLKISHTGELRYVELPDSCSDGAFLVAAHRELDCDMIEFVHLWFFHEHLCLMIDECGKLKDGWQERVNNVASLMYAPGSDCIVGDGLLGRFQRLDDGEIYAVPCEPEFYRDFVKKMCLTFSDVRLIGEVPQMNDTNGKQEAEQ
jgi:hypothetical protein